LFIQQNPTRCSSVSKFIIPYLNEAIASYRKIQQDAAVYQNLLFHI